MIFKLIFLCLTPLLRGIASKAFCVLCDVLFHWDIEFIPLGHCTYSIGTFALILLGHRNYAIGVLQILYWGQTNRTQARFT